MALKTPQNPVGLTRRETEVLRWIATGLTAVEIGEKLYISEWTVSFHANQIYVKLMVNNRLQAVNKARQLGYRIEVPV